MTTYSYQIYGLVVQSSHQLPGLPLPESPAVDDCAGIDVTVEFAGEWSDWTPYNRFSSLSVHDPAGIQIQVIHKDQFINLQYSNPVGGINFRISQNGAHVSATWTTNGDVDRAKSFLYHPVLGYIARIRGATCLHACVVAMNDQAIALLGAVGAGKSTTTAALTQMGWRLIAEDVAVLLVQNGEFWVQPGRTRLRLDRQTIDSIYGREMQTEAIFPNVPVPFQPFKKVYPVVDSDNLVAIEPKKLTAVYILGERSSRYKEPLLQPNSGREGLLALMTNTFATSVLTETARIQEFKTLSQLARQVPIRTMVRPDDLSQLPLICQMILDDLAC